MFRVEYHYQGQGLWNRGAAPMTQLVAAMHARTLREMGFADEARVVPSAPLDRDPGVGVALRV